MMSWAEFVIRSVCFRDTDLYQWKKLRFLAYVSLQAPHVDPKKIPRSIEAFLPLNGEQPESKLTDDRLTAMQRAWDQYEQKVGRVNDKHISEGTISPESP